MIRLLILLTLSVYSLTFLNSEVHGSNVSDFDEAIIGAVFPLNMDEPDWDTFVNQGGIFSLEAFYFALDKVNQMNLIPGVRFGYKVLNGAKLNESAVETFEPLAKLSRNGLKNGEPKLIGVIEGSDPIMKAHVKKLYDDHKIPLLHGGRL
ncbi:hypothetical protein B4U80_12383 [Leptotrombidium deliense]|uniref:Uncharacterized protein n=1 Tax=Leptotrombidium deliense TaxID=299467 RepID=A0A443RUD0_9ACAR|nr:hypothetical protein B4U80_12383 [Leptotrombidium deliense]